MSEVICPDCNGTGRTKGPVHINMGDLPHRWVDSLKCFCCGGARSITREHFDARWRGRKLREERIARGESLLEAAKLQGISPSELSSRERGALFPKQEQTP